MMTKRRILKYSRLGMVVLVAGMVATATMPAFAQNANADMARMAAANTKLQKEVASKLSKNSVLRGQNITVSVTGSQVTLTGRVQTQKQWQEAETVAANVRGVRTILNNLTIAGQSYGNQPGQSRAEQSQAEQNRVARNSNSQLQPPPPPPAQQPGQPPVPASAANGAGNPPPPPPDHQGSQSGQNFQGQAQPRPEYQGQAYQGPGYRSNGGQNGYQGQSYGTQAGNRQYGQAPPEQPSGPVTVAAGTLLRVRTIEPLDSAHVRAGQRFDATVANDVWQGHVLAIPRGAELQGEVVGVAEPKGKLGGRPHLELRLTSLNLSGRRYPLHTNVWSGIGPNKAGYTASNTVTGGALGAIIGAIAGRGAGAAIGAGVGAMAGMGISSATKGPHIYIPSESLLNFHLKDAVTVQPVSWQEAQRLASNVPQLQTRPRYGYRRYPPRMYPYGYAYPPPYYYPPYPYYYGPGYYFGFGW